MIRCTCGHEVRTSAETIVCNIKTVTREDKRAIGTVVLCAACYAENDALKIVLHTEDEEQKWLNRSTP